ncbi:MAG TPA: hypothetical protein VGN88_05760, partial [Phycisphaerae bacterium]
MSETEAGVSLPNAPVLSYITGSSTPTRVRSVAARSMIVLAMIAVAVAAIYMVVWGTRISKELSIIRTPAIVFLGGGGGFAPGPPPGRVTFTEIQQAILRMDYGSGLFTDMRFSHDPLAGIGYFVRLGLWGRITVLATFLVPATALIILAAPVRRGRRVPSILAAWSLFPLLAAAFLATLYEIST